MSKQILIAIMLFDFFDVSKQYYRDGGDAIQQLLHGRRDVSDANNDDRDHYNTTSHDENNCNDDPLIMTEIFVLISNTSLLSQTRRRRNSSSSSSSTVSSLSVDDYDFNHDILQTMDGKMIVDKLDPFPEHTSTSSKTDRLTDDDTINNNISNENYATKISWQDSKEDVPKHSTYSQYRWYSGVLFRRSPCSTTSSNNNRKMFWNDPTSYQANTIILDKKTNGTASTRFDDDDDDSDKYDCNNINGNYDESNVDYGNTMKEGGGGHRIRSKYSRDQSFCSKVFSIMSFTTSK